MIDKWLEKAQSLGQEETLRTRIRHGFGFVCTLALVCSAITVIGEIWVGNRGSLESMMAFGITLLSVIALAALRDRPPITTHPVRTAWDPRTVKSAQERSERTE